MAPFCLRNKEDYCGPLNLLIGVLSSPRQNLHNILTEDLDPKIRLLSRCISNLA